MDHTANEEDLKDNIFSQIIFILHITQKTVTQKEVSDFSWYILQTFTQKNSQREVRNIFIVLQPRSTRFK
jgi:hypothetical protein